MDKRFALDRIKWWSVDHSPCLWFFGDFHRINIDSFFVQQFNKDENIIMISGNFAVSWSWIFFATCFWLSFCFPSIFPLGRKNTHKKRWISRLNSAFHSVHCSSPQKNLASSKLFSKFLFSCKIFGHAHSGLWIVACTNEEMISTWFDGCDRIFDSLTKKFP